MRSISSCKYVLEFSPSQKALHIQRLSDAVEANSRLFKRCPTLMPDFLPLFIGTRSQCERMAKIAEMNLHMEQKLFQQQVVH